jgi:flagellar protein FliS
LCPNGYGGFSVGYTNAYNVYKETSVKTASQGKLIILLYQEAVKQLGNACDFIDDNGKILPQNIEKFGKCIQKTQEIISELMVSLDMEKGGEIAKNLMSLYVFFNAELMNANISKDKAKIQNIKKMLFDLLGAWNVAVESTAPVSSPTTRLNIDIEG